MKITFDSIHGADSVASCPRFDIDEETYKKVNRLLTPYIFYKKHGNSSARLCFCTRCEEQYIVGDRTMDYNDQVIINASHNEEVVCPICGTKATLKSIGKAKSCYNLFECKNVAIVFKKSKDNIIVATYEIMKKYGGGYYKAPVDFYPQFIYQITPQGANCWRYHYYGKQMNKASKCYKSHAEHIINAELLDKTFLKYSGYQYYLNRPDRFANFLCNAPTHPTYEMMLKLGFKEFVDESVDGKDNTRIINWKGKKPTDVFKKLNKQQFNEFRELGGSIQLYKDWVYLNKHGTFSLKQTSRIKGMSWQWQIVIEKAQTLGISTNDFINYCDRQHEKNRVKFKHINTLNHWYDYITDAEFLKYDLTDKVVILPKNIFTAHDTANDLRNAVREEERRQAEERRNQERAAQAEKDKETLFANKKLVSKEKTLYKKRSNKYNYQNSEYLIRLPKDMREVIDEGQTLHHCVGGYAQRHAEGKTTILFMRSASEPDKPLYTIEMHDKDLRQVHGLRNRPIEEENAKQFFNEWLEWVKAGSPKQEEPKNTIDITIAIPIKNNIERVTA